MGARRDPSEPRHDLHEIGELPPVVRWEAGTARSGLGAAQPRGRKVSGTHVMEDPVGEQMLLLAAAAQPGRQRTGEPGPGCLVSEESQPALDALRGGRLPHIVQKARQLHPREPGVPADRLKGV